MTAVVWLTGLSGAGKSTLALALEQHWTAQGRASCVLNGDKLMNNAGLWVIAACISPYRADRSLAPAIVGDQRFVEVHVSTPLAVCEQPDVKGLYQRARAGQLPEFPGISLPYEIPQNPAASIDTSKFTVEQALAQLTSCLDARQA